jgi:NitT/TauT family transport system substrate-binding protein
VKKSLFGTAAIAAALIIAVSGCSLDSATNSSGNVVNVVIGYQSKTINTVTAGTLLRAQGYLERRLADVTTRTGTGYNVTWQDYDTGAPITAQMVAEKIDIGAMGDYPMLINGSKTQANERAHTEMSPSRDTTPRAR